MAVDRAVAQEREDIMAPLIAFDVNETLLDLAALDPLFARIFGDPAAGHVV